MAHIHLNNVCIDFPIFNSKAKPTHNGFLKKVVGGRLSKSKSTAAVRALDNITAQFEKGDKVGLVGHNGAGKTTLLRVLAGVYPPTQGSINTEGKIAPLFDISLGFDLEATGYDNILLRGLFLGSTKSAIIDNMQGIIAFTGLGNYLDMPLRTYSSGMLMRLAFAIATATKPDIILMDEWIGVGDSAFMDQATKRLESFIGNSNIMVLASHSEELIRSTCNKAILLGQGQILAQGYVNDVFDHYHFFGSSNLFNMEEYISLYPDLKDATDAGGLAPWMHFIHYGIFEGRSPGFGIKLEAFSEDPIFNQAVEVRDGLAAAERIERIAPFLKSFDPPDNWQKPETILYPEDFISPKQHPLLSAEESAILYQ
jgi:ABC-type polysaccharide/polyol phosphate transport system ATPase subunit